jgi:NADH-quinone oxidoreductase subunit H
MQAYIDSLILNSSTLQMLPRDLVYGIFQALVCVLMFAGFFAPLAAILVFVERRVAGRMQSRVGPNRVGPQGILQSVADGIKLLLKEDIIPDNADKPLFRIAPYLVFLGVFMSFVVIPFSSKVVVADFDISIFYLLAVESLVVVGVVMSGWASNNKWSLLGGMRAAAQIISYEVPVSMTVLMIVMMTGSMSVQGIIGAQGAWPWEWNLFHTPFTFVGFFILFTGSLAEGNRTPFDIPEAESELVSGYNTEYSGFRFSIFFLAEFANIYLIGALSTILFLGGWQAMPLVNALGLAGTGWQHLIEFATFFTKVSVLMFIVIQLRWTLPRVRIDQLMGLCWKYLVPACFVNLLVMALWQVVVVSLPPIVPQMISYVMAALGGVALAYFFWRVKYHLQYSKSPITFNPMS